MSTGKSGEERSFTEAVSTKLDESTKQALDEWADDRELATSQAVRRIIYDHIERERSITPEAYVPGLFAAGVIGIVAGLSSPVEPVIIGLAVASTIAAILIDYFFS